MTIRQEKVSELLKKQASDYIMKEANTSSLITVTRADVAPNLRNATIYVTVLPEDKENEAVEFLKRKEYDFRGSVIKSGAFKYAPHITFVIDLGEKNRLIIDELSKEL